VDVVRPAEVAAAPQPKVAPAPAPRARATRCSAKPATVYGQEDVVFHVDGEGPPAATVDVELRDEHERTISKAALAVPGELRLPQVPSGDFVLLVGFDGGSSPVSREIRCAVTVNRELSRASASTQKK